MFQTNVVQKVKYILYVLHIFSENHAIYEMMCKNVVQPDRPQVKIKCVAEKMQFACRITKVRM
jgi:hypothetical protein